jgi:hypothetical protein
MHYVNICQNYFKSCDTLSELVHKNIGQDFITDVTATNSIPGLFMRLMDQAYSNHYVNTIQLMEMRQNEAVARLTSRVVSK